MSAKRITMLVRNTVHNDNRVLKEAAALAEAGYAVTVMGVRGEGLPNEETYAGARILRVDGAGTTRANLLRGKKRRDEFIRTAFPREIASVLGFMNAKSLRIANGLVWGLEPLAYLHDFDRAVDCASGELIADLWWAHDLNTLPTALRLARRYGGKSVYDSHEYWLDCNNVYSPFAKRVWEVLEKRLIKRADRVVTVSGSIARHLAAQYGLPEPAVVLNTPPYRGEKRALQLRETYGVMTAHVLVYVGLVTHQRGYEQVIEALRELPDVTVLCFGHGAEAYRKGLVEAAAAAGVGERFRLVGSVKPEEIQPAIGAADAGLVAVQRGALSYNYALPSKLFEYVFAGLPVVAGDLVEIRALVGEYALGVCVDERDPKALAAGIRNLLAARDSYRGPDWERRRRSFIDRFAWDRHKSVLVGLVDELLGVERVLP